MEKQTATQESPQTLKNDTVNTLEKQLSELNNRYNVLYKRYEKLFNLYVNSKNNFRKK